MAATPPHVLVIPYPVQGHVLPLMNLSQSLASQGFRITFINTESNHTRMVNSSPHEDTALTDGIKLVCIRDGLDSPEEMEKPGNSSELVLRVMPGKVEEVIRQMNGAGHDEGDKITCLIADQSIGWALEIAAKHGIKRAAFCTAAAASLTLGLRIPKLVEDGVIDSDGTPLRDETLKLSSDMPEMKTRQFAWACLGNKDSQRKIFQLMLNNINSLRLTPWILCNTVDALEPTAIALAPSITPVGPVGDAVGKASLSGTFWREDRSCLEWLDEQPSESVVYVAFGSFPFSDQTQLQELALGLEQTNMPILWATRDPTAAMLCPPHSKVVAWAPQREVLAHRAVACFVTHCGWNSVLEGVARGARFVCWARFGDQFVNEAYVCDAWRVGLRIWRDGEGVLRASEIKDKVGMVLGDGGFKERALRLKDAVRSSGSPKNLEDFVEWIRT